MSHWWLLVNETFCFVIVWSIKTNTASVAASDRSFKLHALSLVCSRREWHQTKTSSWEFYIRIKKNTCQDLCQSSPHLTEWQLVLFAMVQTYRQHLCSALCLRSRLHLSSVVQDVQQRIESGKKKKKKKTVKRKSRNSLGTRQTPRTRCSWLDNHIPLPWYRWADPQVDGMDCGLSNDTAARASRIIPRTKSCRPFFPGHHDSSQQTGVWTRWILPLCRPDKRMCIWTRWNKSINFRHRWSVCDQNKRSAKKFELARRIKESTNLWIVSGGSFALRTLFLAGNETKLLIRVLTECLLGGSPSPSCANRNVSDTSQQYPENNNKVRTEICAGA